MLAPVTNTTDALLADTLEPINTGVLAPVTNTTDALLADTLEPINTGVLGPVTNTTGPLADTLPSVTAVVDPVTGLEQTVTAPVDPVAAVDPVTQTVQPVFETVEPLPAAVGDDDGGSMWTFPFDGLAGGTPGAEEVLIISALAAAGATALQARFFLANVPPIPLTCMVGEARCVTCPRSHRSRPSTERRAQPEGPWQGESGTRRQSSARPYETASSEAPAASRTARTTRRSTPVS